MAKVDPRSDPVSNPPAEGVDDFSVDRVLAPNIVAHASARSKRALPDAAAPESSVVAVDAKVGTPTVTSPDPRYEALEKLLDRNDWKGICEVLGTLDDAGKLPPNLGLLAAIAHNEDAKDGHPEAVSTAIRCMASLLGVSLDSPLARVIARRLLRKNPVRIRDRQAPPARTSLLIVLLTLVLGGGVGWLASIGSWRGIAHLLHLG